MRSPQARAGRAPRPATTIASNSRGLLEPGLDVAAQLGEREVGSQRPRAARAGAPSRCRRARRCGSASSVAPTSASRGSPRSGTAASTRPAGRRRGQVLGRVHREVGAAVEHRLLHLLHEHAGAAERVDRRRRCAGRRVVDDDHQLGVAAEQRDHALRLPPRQRAAPRVATRRRRVIPSSASSSGAPAGRRARRARRRRARRGRCRRRP